MGRISKTNRKRHNLDRRADKIAADVAGSIPNDSLISTAQVAHLLGVSEQWCELARMRGHGPAFVKLSARCVRYRKEDVLRWLDERARASMIRAVA